MFVPNTIESRTAIVSGFVAELGVQATISLFKQATKLSVEGPIFMLGGDTDAESGELMRDYELIMSALKSVAEGRSINVLNN